MIDLHLHSLFSDGCCTPEELIEMIANMGLKAAALTDHDVVDGCVRFEMAGAKKGIYTFGASELSAHYPRVTMEIVALDIPNASLSDFKARQKVLIEERMNVAKQRLELLAKIGIDISWEDIAFYDNGEPRNQIGKPHIVQAMLKKGYIDNWDEGFEKYLNKGCPAHVVKKEPEFDEVIRFVRDSGAVPILAHPVHTKRQGQELFELVKELKYCGLEGIEVFHSDHDRGLRRDYLLMIEELGMIASGGSDFHGGAHPEVRIGVGKGDLEVPDAIFYQIKERGNIGTAYYRELEKYV